MLEKAVIIMYPDYRSTGGLPLVKTPGMRTVLAESYYNYAKKRLQRYTREGYHTVAVVYPDTSEETFSPLYPYASFQQFVRIPLKPHELHMKQHGEILQSLNFALAPKARVVVGGYHANACVADMAAVLENNGHRVTPNLTLTDQGGFLQMAHYARSILGRHYQEEDAEWNRLLWQVNYDQFHYAVSQRRTGRNPYGEVVK